LLAFIEDKEELLTEAGAQDLGKPLFECWLGELVVVKAEIEYTLKHLKKWTRPRRVAAGLVQQPARAYVVQEPKGTVLIIGPWNYPAQLVLLPLMAAVSGGNSVVLKPSELAPHTSAVIAEWLPRYVDNEAIAVIEGGIEVSQALLSEPFDHIFFTGSTNIGRIVMQEAAKNLTPVTLELGGKSPCIIDYDVDLVAAARRVTWAKFFNAGQTCVSPDYILVDKRVAGQFVEEVKKCIRNFYGEDPQESPDFGRIINDRHFARVVGLMEGAGNILHGGSHDANSRYISPTVIGDVNLDAEIMQDEIFGPLMPIIPIQDLDDAVDQIKSRPKPLALYLFTKRRSAKRFILENTSSGGLAINDCMAHLAVPGLPFGGIGESGIGSYHGEAGFLTFTHAKSVLDKGTFPDPSLRYPPYTESNRRWARRLM